MYMCVLVEIQLMLVIKVNIAIDIHLNSKQLNILTIEIVVENARYKFQ